MLSLMHARWIRLPITAVFLLGLILGLTACTTVQDTRRQMSAAFADYQLKESLSGRFSLRVIAQAGNRATEQRGGQGHFDWLFYTTPNQTTSRHVLIWSTALGQSLGRLEWHVDPRAAISDPATRHQFLIFDSQNRRLAPQEQMAWVAEILGQPVSNDALNPLIEEIMTAFARTARFPGPTNMQGPQDFYFTHPPLVVSLRIIADRK
jgi:hypothetical protein